MISESCDSLIRMIRANHEPESLICYLKNPNHESESIIHQIQKSNHGSESSLLPSTESESEPESLNQKTPNPNDIPNPTYIIDEYRIMDRTIISRPFST